MLFSPVLSRIVRSNQKPAINEILDLKRKHTEDLKKNEN